MAYPWVEPSQRNSVAWDPQGSYGPAAPALEARIKALPHEIRDEDIERDKAGHRGLFLAEFRKVLELCDQGDPDDPRWSELRLRTLDRMGKLLRVYEPDAPTVRSGPTDARILAGQAAAALLDLEASLAETRAPS
jgi:hypothetical protein